MIEHRKHIAHNGSSCLYLTALTTRVHLFRVFWAKRILLVEQIYLKKEKKYLVKQSHGVENTQNSIKPEQTAPLGAVWAGFTLSAHAYLPKCLG